ncbi:putative inactive receptor kinase [Sesamum angolense]|uniref:Inactive receptor kinase n=1 Tax=Sesamum angolense TaxID=2727404 RepID=A0AAE1W1Q5_9LAMI|nr:putative inactive receptor kinase [Sesamum angolense]
MSAIYDNWERLVAAVLRKQQLWELFHDHSRSPSILSEASDSSASFNSSSRLRDLAFDVSRYGSFSGSWRASPKLVLISDFIPAIDIKEAYVVFPKFLGTGTFGSAYTAAMNNGVRIVVKRLSKSPTISEVDFKRHMDIVGKIRHENVVAVRAYYSSEEERLMLYDYYSKGSVYEFYMDTRFNDINRATLGKTGESPAQVDWETRLKIAIGAARGIAAIHAQNGGKLVHGNIKATNIFLNSQDYGCVSDLGLTNMIATTFMSTARCYAPEVKNTRDVSQASDVYSFGILLLQLLTRKPPIHVPGGHEVVDLVKLVSSVKRKSTVSSRGKLVFLEHSNATFELEDMLRASAEVLGKGTFGTSYKASLDNGNTIMAYYFSKEEVLLVYDYQNQESLSALLHGPGKVPLGWKTRLNIAVGTGNTPLDWTTRLRIAVGAARGIAHIHQQDGGKLVHGNINSSNIFLNGQEYGLVSDVGLAKVMNLVGRSALRTQGYCAPEVRDTTEVSQASDVYSFGVVLLELLSRQPSQWTKNGRIGSLVDSIQYVSHREWTTVEVDFELLRYRDEEETILQTVRIAMDCVATVPESRPRMPEVVKILEEISGIEPFNDVWEDTLGGQSIESRLEDLLDHLLPTLTL